MHPKITATPGTWASNIDAFLVANGSARLADLRRHNDATYWLESVAAEQGRMTIMRHQHGETKSILPQPYNVRSKVHEYGGAPYCIADDAIYFVDAKDQSIRRLEVTQSLGTEAIPEPTVLIHHEGHRFGDLIWLPKQKCVVAVRERHSTPQANNAEQADKPAGQNSVKNDLVAINQAGEVNILASGADFYAYPRYSPTSASLCWITWDHPHMPWDKTTLSIATLNQDGTLSDERSIDTASEGSNAECSILQPSWTHNDDLIYVSDQNNWWNLYRLTQVNSDAKPKAEAMRSTDAEYATPLWVLGMQHYAISEHTLYAAKNRLGTWSLEYIDLSKLEVIELPNTFSYVDSMWADASGAYFIASTASRFSSIYKLDAATHTLSILSQSPEARVEELSDPESLHINSKTGDAIHAFYYPPHNSRYQSDKAPPLIVLCHGGPTGQTSSELNYKIQYWTNRGFAVVDVNYRGSTGFGRPFRRMLYKHWGKHDVEDVVTVVDHLIEKQKAAEDQIIIKGSSAGGYTVLAALAFSERFNAGVSLYGIGDLELLATDTHKFEKYYLEQLVGPYPSERQCYIDRSPIHSSEKLSCPILLFQGLEDKVVPPNQARTMATAAEKNGLAVGLVEFPEEGHGFRSPSNIERMLEAELYFYQKVFRLGEAKKPKGITIKNLD